MPYRVFRGEGWQVNDWRVEGGIEYKVCGCGSVYNASARAIRG
ncbi:MAG TPA: hypothetical protein VNE82_11515 [Candidatus Binataceae bacterium]|nr:hypothetical protein [Candidatus Binataceae bacterium]